MHPSAESKARAYDPLAVALGNASLLGIGYLMLRRRVLAVLAVAVAVGLGYVVNRYQRPWCEYVVLGWWVAVIAHGWLLARWRADRVRRNRQRIVGLAATLVVLLVVGLLRFDVSGIEHRVTRARADGNCAKVISTQQGVWLGDRLADAPLAVRGDVTVQACRRLRQAEADLRTGLSGDTGALQQGFGTLAAVLAQPGNGKTVGTVLNGFLRGLPVPDACRTVTITDWLRARRPSHNELDTSADTAARIAPAALTGCGNALMSARNWTKARHYYQRLIEEYPHDGHVPEARAAIHHATLQIDLAHVEYLLGDAQEDANSEPRYCTKPAAYSAAPAYHTGVNRARFVGDDTYTKDLPSSWRAPDVAHTALVVCVGYAGYGPADQSCPYKSDSGTTTEVTFYQVEVAVKVYELRTGKLVAHPNLDIDGTSCPPFISYETFGDDDDPGPTDQNVSPGKADIRTAFAPLIER
jgi:hypothetical protein